MVDDFPPDLAAAMRGEYVEDFVLRRYIWRNYRHALSDRELALHRAATLELKARHATEDVASRIRSMDGFFFDPDVAEIAQHGLANFEARCCERLMRDHKDEIFVNRCGACGRVVASPIACACTWCGNHWYARRAEMVDRARSAIYPDPKKSG